jgi:hypothetical protein
MIGWLQAVSRWIRGYRMTTCLCCDKKVVLVRPGAPARHLSPWCDGWTRAVHADEKWAQTGSQ